MKKISIVLIALLSIITTGCTLEPSNNEELDGMWCLTRVDTIANGKFDSNYRQQRVFWSFQGTLMQTQKFNAYDAYRYIYSFSREGNILKVNNPYLIDRAQGDIIMTEDSLHVLQPQGINSLEESYTIEQLNSNNMVLNDNILRLYFEKY